MLAELPGSPRSVSGLVDGLGEFLCSAQDEERSDMRYSRRLHVHCNRGSLVCLREKLHTKGGWREVEFDK